MSVALVLGHTDVRLTQRYYIDLRINDTAVDCFPVRGSMSSPPTMVYDLQAGAGRARQVPSE